MNPLVLWFHKLGSPPYFYRLAGRLLPWLWGLALALPLMAIVKVIITYLREDDEVREPEFKMA